MAEYPGTTVSKTHSSAETAPREDDVVLETSDLTKTFGALVANDRISFDVREGEIRGLIGPNGSGKSTFFNTVTGFYSPDGGTVTFDGVDITGWKAHRIAQQGLARTFQITTPFEELSVRDNLLAVPTDGSRGERRSRAGEILEFLEIDHLAEEKAKEMSGGQQKLLELARVLMLEPNCILLDEPMAGVNPALQERIMDHIREMNRDGTTFVIVEHDIDMIREIADTVSVFDQGRLIAQGDFEEVTRDTGVREAYLGTDDDSDAQTDSTEMIEQAVDEGKVRTDTGDAAIVAEDVVTGYGNHEVVHGVSIRSREGVTCILGPNGSGKSTVLKSLNGQVPVWSGSVHYRGTDISDEGPLEIVRRGIATLPQEGGVLGTLSVEDNLTLGARNVLKDKDAVQRNLERVLEEFPILEEKLDEKADDLSGGQQMMVSFGRAMMTDADVYLLDEPTAGLAPSLVDDVLELIDVLVADDAEVVLIEQNVKAALKIADYAYILAQGDLQFEGTPNELTDEDELMEIYLGL